MLVFRNGSILLSLALTKLDYTENWAHTQFFICHPSGWRLS